MKFGKIKENSIFALLTGWDKFWNDPIKYRGVNESDHKMHFPVYSYEAAEFLICKRRVTALGIDTLSPEIVNDFPIHKLVLGESKYLIENLTNLEKMPFSGGIISIAPLKFQALSESPVRAIGMTLKN